MSKVKTQNEINYDIVYNFLNRLFIPYILGHNYF